MFASVVTSVCNQRPFRLEFQIRMALKKTAYYGCGCAESEKFKFFDDEPAGFVPFSLEFILPGRFFLRVEGSQLVQSRYNFLVAESDLVLIVQAGVFQEAGPFYFVHSTVNNDYLILKDIFGCPFLHPKYYCLNSSILRSTVTAAERKRKFNGSSGDNSGATSSSQVHKLCANTNPNEHSGHDVTAQVLEKPPIHIKSPIYINSAPMSPLQPSPAQPSPTVAEAQQDQPPIILPPVKCCPGRPRGTKNHPPIQQQQQSAANEPVQIPAQKRRPGRPPGTNNPTIQSSKNPANSSEPGMAVKWKRVAPQKRLELSITICVAGGDISPTIFPLIQNFLDQQCESGVFAVERGGSLLNLHVQGVIALICSSPIDAKKRITAAVEWDQERPLGAAVCVQTKGFIVLSAWSVIA
ncbi:hypothetical protein R1sor_001337 [Riccia sorocarpa]|uniref:Uncharacterized protein n=1 Tax=Riccia sorocarpa TaxID=122646 RepID=A0ABD3GYT7_9MARC